MEDVELFVGGGVVQNLHDGLVLRRADLVVLQRGVGHGATMNLHPRLVVLRDVGREPARGWS